MLLVQTCQRSDTVCAERHFTRQSVDQALCCRSLFCIKLQSNTVQAKAGKKRRELQRQVLFTMPIRPRAGQNVKVYYNPDATPLRGRPEAWLRGGWNRLAVSPFKKDK